MSTISASTTSTTAYKVTADTTGTLVLQTGSTPTTAITIDTAQNMGLGVTPSAWSATVPALQIGSGGSFLAGYGALSWVGLGTNAHFNGTNWIYKTSTNLASYYQQSAGVHSWYTAASGTAGNAISFTQAMTLDASGNLLLGTTTLTAITSGIANLNLGSSSAATSGGIAYQISGATVKAYDYVESNVRKLQTASGVSIAFIPAGTEAARIDTSGNLLVGTTNSSNTAGTGLKFSANGLAASVLANSGTASDTWNVYNTTAGAFRFYVTNGGTIFATSTTISAISDERLKENVRDLEFGLSEVMALKPRRFDWKEGKGQDKKNAAGFIAQEFETVFPDSVGLSKAGKDGVEYKNINHEELIPTLVKAIQEQQAIIETLTNRITALEAK